MHHSIDGLMNNNCIYPRFEPCSQKKVATNFVELTAERKNYFLFLYKKLFNNKLTRTRITHR